MDENRERYHQAKERWLEEVAAILATLGEHEERFNLIEPKSTLSRINNNRRFHPEKPVYKDFFSCDLGQGDGELSSLYLAVGPGNSFVGAGLHHPSSEVLKKYYQAVDYDGDTFKEILADEKVKSFFGGLTPDDNDLKTAPRGYDTDHEHVDLLRKKSITLMRELTEEEVCADDFPKLIEEAYLALGPFNEYLSKAVNFEQ